MIAVAKGGRWLRISRHDTEWVELREDATFFASEAALAQCFAFGRLRHLGLKFTGWVE